MTKKLLTFALLIATAAYSATVFKTETDGVPYRIPALAKCQNGDLIAISDYRFCKADIGFGPIDLHYRISHDSGNTWGEEYVLAKGNQQLKGNDWRYAYGDACIVADCESSEVVVFCVGGHVVFFDATRDNPQHIVRFRSHDNGQTWDSGTCITEQIYSLYDQRTIGRPKSIFLTSGRILQSHIIKNGKYYRLYIAHPIREGGASVIYSDDFGETWQVLGHADHLPSKFCDESVVEEMPDGSLLLSVRERGARMINIFTYTDTRTAEGYWSTEVSAKGMEGVNACNGEMLMVPALRQSDRQKVDILLHSIPQSSERTNVGFYYKEIASPDDYVNGSAAASNWQKGLQVSEISSCYSTMQLLDNGNIGFLYEENGQNSGYDINYQKLTLEEITKGLYQYDNR